MAQQGDLFAAVPRHDPGGKVRLPLPGGMTGEARISACERYRPFLLRDWTPAGQAPRGILWIGQNPSTADAFVSDPTVRREETFSRDWGFTRYYKGNILDWRATRPADLPPDPRLARSSENLPSILEMAEESERVIAAFGKLHKRYHPLIEETLRALAGVGRPVMCLGRNLDGSPKHPLYLRKDSAPQPFFDAE